MAVSTNGDGAAPAAVPFSYAQAAKGRAAAPITSTPPAAAPVAAISKESSSWGDDSSDAHTATEEHQGNGLSNGAPVKPRASDKPASNGHQSDPTNAVSHPSSPHYDSSATTAKEDDISSPVKASSDSIWDRKSSSSQVDESTHESGKVTESNQATNNDQEAAQPEPKPMKEAPAPVVNFWQKRAEDAKLKQGGSSINPGSAQNDSSSGRVSHSIKSNSDTPSITQISSQSNSNNANATPPEKLPAGDKARSSKPARAQKSDPAPQKSAPPPPTRDESAWPTPLNAQDEERRKAQEREDKSERERPQPTTTKTHKKNEWVPVPHTPSVKFTTPIPQTRGRGGRGGRGARGGSMSERGHVLSGNASREDSAAVEPRGRVEKDGRRSSVQITNGSRTSSTNQATSNDKRTTPFNANKRLSLQEDTIHGRTDQPGQRQGRTMTEKSNAVSKSTATPIGSNEELPGPKPKPDGQDTQGFDRRKSISTQSESTFDGAQQARQKRPSPNGDAQQDTNVDGKSVRTYVGTEQANTASKPNRLDARGGASRPFDSHRDSWGSLPFREGRSAVRGRAQRGGHFPLSHHTAGQMQNNATLSPIQTNGPFSPKSTTAYQSQYFAHANQAGSDRRSYPSGPRSASIPSDLSYGRYGQAYPGSQQQTMYSPYMHAAYDYGAAPMSAIPYTPSMDQSMVVNGVTFQLNYYFSLENLLKDVYLRKHMDSQGFVSLNFIANFQRMKDLTTDLELIKYACLQSPEFELRQGTDGHSRIRAREHWDKWVLSMEERDPSARTDGPPPSEQPKVNAPSAFDVHSPSRTPYPDMINQRIDANSVPFGLAPSFQPVAVSSPIDEARSPPEIQAEQSPSGVGNSGLGSQYALSDPTPNGVGDYGQEDVDSFPSSRIPFLTVAVRPYGSSASRRVSRSETSRTFSNGSISMEELKLSDDAHSQLQTRSQPEDPADGDQLQKVLNSRKQLQSPSSTKNDPSPDSVELFWFKGQEARQPLPSNCNAELYVQLHFKALEERQHAESGSCPYDLDVLYQFWSHFLIRNFNTTMYNEFRQLAHDDAAQGLSNVGMQSLITFYSEALSSQQPIRDRVARHYISLVKNEDSTKGRPAFEQLRSAWRNGALNMKNRKRISAYVDRELRDELDRADR